MVEAQDVKKLREKTGAPMMDCKRALQDTSGNFEKAIDYLRKKGMADASKKAGRVAAEGIVHSYIHGGGRIGVLVEVNCETDFVARNPDFQAFVKEIALHIAAAHPQYVSESDVPEEVLKREKEIYLHQAKASKKPQAVMDKMVEGKIQKFYDEVCLLRQPFIKDQDKTISDLLKQLIAKIGENCQIRRFVRYQVGEGIEKKVQNFAQEVASQLK
ncbi:MAG: translation elongation factor Ts [Deltaproteobacteria bacterium]|nr:translation elongation factor Ts [Deltaproteobacteria bacterium]